MTLQAGPSVDDCRTIVLQTIENEIGSIAVAEPERGPFEIKRVHYL